ncbi:glycoside hydrolase family 73 protein [Heyndrickxia oleronia]|uniref:glycoside hydrolase family 73 protein n=1 Tax=Heyndrickxia oleronia TaxID=38875 RepID=UPI00204011EA|nr:glycoside hydrolase family 73 protein [Heyndrickxia oleronia]MCM3454086.1 glycoside hydrolase family 73 protein [Heyndrickxia oleronia]
MSFINEITPYAQRIQKDYGILASLIIAQAILESNWGKSTLAVKGKNIFGIKGEYKGQSIILETTEYVNGKPVKVDKAFRKYPTWFESMVDLANLYNTGDSRGRYKKIIGETDYKKAAKEVKNSGYATDPNYANKIIEIIESNELTKYDSTELSSIRDDSKNLNKEVPIVSVRDINKVSTWAEKDWKEATSNGYYDGTRPGANLTREESAIVINRLRNNFLKLIAKNKEDIQRLETRLQEIEKQNHLI